MWVLILPGTYSLFLIPMPSDTVPYYHSSDDHSDDKKKKQLELVKSLMINEKCL